MILNLKYIGLQEKCLHVLDILKRKYKDHFILIEGFYIWLNYFFYKKMKNEYISRTTLIKKYDNMIPKQLKGKKIYRNMLKQMDDIITNYSGDINIRCISNPINININNNNLIGYMNLITKNKNKYKIHQFIYKDIPHYDNTFAEKITPGFLAASFLSDFHLDNFELTIHSLNSKHKIKTIYFDKPKIELFRDKSFELITNIEQNCSSCEFKRECKYEKRN